METVRNSERSQKGNTIRFGFLVLDGFPMSCLTSAIDPLRSANEITGTEAFSWQLVSEIPGRVRSSAGIGFDPDISLGHAMPLDYLFLLAGPSGDFADPKSGNARLRSLARHGVRMGSVSGGTFALARSGLLDGVVCSVHWCYEAAFAAEFPRLVKTDDVITIDRGLYTVSGAAAMFDLMLHVIEERLGEAEATEVACWFQHPLMRGRGVRQKIPTGRRESTSDMLPGPVARAVRIFGANISTPRALSEVASEVGLSPRQFERAFKRATGQSPSRYYLMLRMNAARQMVIYSKDTMTDIAVAVGYSTTGPLLRHYRREFGISPNEERRKINLFRVESNKAIPSG